MKKARGTGLRAWSLEHGAWGAGHKTQSIRLGAQSMAQNNLHFRLKAPGIGY